jgi:hypothetical protein
MYKSPVTTNNPFIFHNRAPLKIKWTLFAEANFPRFAEPIPNITVTVGRDALLACVVDNLKGYKVKKIYKKFCNKKKLFSSQSLTFRELFTKKEILVAQIHLVRFALS